MQYMPSTMLCSAVVTRGLVPCILIFTTPSACGRWRTTQRGANERMGTSPLVPRHWRSLKPIGSKAMSTEASPPQNRKERQCQPKSQRHQGMHQPRANVPMAGPNLTYCPSQQKGPQLKIEVDKTVTCHAKTIPLGSKALR